MLIGNDLTEEITGRMRPACYFSMNLLSCCRNIDGLFQLIAQCFCDPVIQSDRAISEKGRALSA